MLHLGTKDHFHRYTVHGALIQEFSAIVKNNF